MGQHRPRRHNITYGRIAREPPFVATCQSCWKSPLMVIGHYAHDAESDGGAKSSPLHQSRAIFCALQFVPQDRKVIGQLDSRGDQRRANRAINRYIVKTCRVARIVRSPPRRTRGS